jgi:hypothetical protein
VFKGVLSLDGKEVENRSNARMEIRFYCAQEILDNGGVN